MRPGREVAGASLVGHSSPQPIGLIASQHSCGWVRRCTRLNAPEDVRLAGAGTRVREQVLLLQRNRVHRHARRLPAVGRLYRLRGHAFVVALRRRIQARQHGLQRHQRAVDVRGPAAGVT